MTMRYLFRLCCVALATLAATCDAAEHTQDSLAQVQTAITENKAVLIDVREKNEWDAGHLRDARLVPLSVLPQLINEGKITQQLPKDKIIYCHCKSGGRVLKAADLLKAQGYDIRPLKSGYSALVEAGFPVAPVK